MTLMNNLSVCQGTFSRIEGGKCTIVDYGLVEDEYCHLVEKFLIDEKKKFAQGSDHVLLRMTLKLNGTRAQNRGKVDVVSFRIHDRTDFS